MNTLRTTLTVLLSAGSVLVSSPVMAMQASGSELSSILSGPVSQSTLTRLAAGERTSVIVMLDVSMDEVIAAAEDDPEGDYLRDRMAQTRRAVVQEALPRLRAAELSLEDAVDSYMPFEVTPGFAVTANAARVMRRTRSSRVTCPVRKRRRSARKWASASPA